MNLNRTIFIFSWFLFACAGITTTSIKSMELMHTNASEGKKNAEQRISQIVYLCKQVMTPGKKSKDKDLLVEEIEELQTLNVTRLGLLKDLQKYYPRSIDPSSKPCLARYFQEAIDFVDHFDIRQSLTEFQRHNEYEHTISKAQELVQCLSVFYNYELFLMLHISQS